MGLGQMAADGGRAILLIFLGIVIVATSFAAGVHSQGPRLQAWRAYDSKRFSQKQFEERLAARYEQIETKLMWLDAYTRLRSPLFSEDDRGLTAPRVAKFAQTARDFTFARNMSKARPSRPPPRARRPAAPIRPRVAGVLRVRRDPADAPARQEALLHLLARLPLGPLGRASHGVGARGDALRGAPRSRRDISPRCARHALHRCGARRSSRSTYRTSRRTLRTSTTGRCSSICTASGSATGQIAACNTRIAAHFVRRAFLSQPGH